MEYFNIAIDGPAGAGKSTIAKLAAKRLGFVYVDTGAMYRSMALYFIRQGISPEDEEAIAGACGQVEVTIRYADGVQQVILNGEDVSGLIRSEEVGRMASATSVYRPVREKLVQLQKQLVDGILIARTCRRAVRIGSDGQDTETVSPELVHAEELRTGERPVLLLGTQLCLLIRFLNAEEHFLDRHAFHAVVLFFFLHKRFVLWI